MNKIVFFFLFISCVLLCSCDKRQTAINDLENFSEELKENCSEYSYQDWEEASAQYEQLVEQIDQYEYTDEELKEIGKLKARCLKQMSMGAMKQLQGRIHSFTKQMEGALEELGGGDTDEASDE